MGMRSTWRPSFGPFHLNTGMHGPTSLTFRMFGVSYRLWSKKGERGLSSVDLPGPFSYRPSRRRK